MRLLLAAILGFWFLARPPFVDIGAIPLTQLTLNMGFDNLWAGVIGFGCLAAFIWSIGKDQVWPWRWRWHGWKDAVGRMVMVPCCGVFAYAWRNSSSEWWYSLLLIPCSIIGALYFLAAEDPLENKPKVEVETPVVGGD